MAALRRVCADWKLNGASSFESLGDQVPMHENRVSAASPAMESGTHFEVFARAYSGASPSGAA